jgi:hypothetical protein
MYMLLLGLALALPASPVTSPSHVVAAAPDTLTCSVTAAGPAASRHCSVSIPSRREVLACSSADRATHRCATPFGAARTAWVTSTKGAKCKISAKHSDFKRKVTLSMSKKTARAIGAACALHVVVR